MSKSERKRSFEGKLKEQPLRVKRREMFGKVLKYGGTLAGGLAVGGVGGSVGGYDAGFDEGFAKGHAAEESESLEITTEPYNLQIARFEYRFRDADLLTRKDVRNQFALLVALWYGQDKTHAIFTQRDVPHAAGKRIYDAIEWIESKDDERLKGFEGALGWVARDEDKIRINLTDESFRKGYTTSTGAPLSPLTTLRDVLTHEMTHLIARRREKSEIISFFKETEPQKPQTVDSFVRGFRVYLKTDPQADYLAVYYDLDEVATEIISKYWQETSGMGPGLPTYSEDAIPGIDTFIRRLRGTLDILDISIEDFSFFHAWSDLDGLTKKLFGKVGTEELSGMIKIIDSVRSGNLEIRYGGT